MTHYNDGRGGGRREWRWGFGEQEGGVDRRGDESCSSEGDVRFLNDLGLGVGSKLLIEEGFCFLLVGRGETRDVLFADELL